MGDFNPDAIELLEEADVYYHFLSDTVTAPTTVTADWAAGWKQFGSLGPDGIVEGRTSSQTKYYDLNNRLIKVSNREAAATLGLTIFQVDEDTIPIIYPGSTETDIKLGVPAPKVKLGVEFREGLHVVRWVTKNYAQINVTGDTTHGGSPTGYAAVADIFPDAAKSIWTRIEGELPSP